jgi:hypothetical protein
LFLGVVQIHSVLEAIRRDLAHSGN